MNDSDESFTGVRCGDARPGRFCFRVGGCARVTDTRALTQLGEYLTDTGRVAEGIRVLDVSEAGLAPVCCRILADMGAEVIKVERTQGGDQTRGILKISGNVPVYVTDDAPIESGGGKDMLSGKKIGALVMAMTASVVMSNVAMIVDASQIELVGICNVSGLCPIFPRRCNRYR
jgi:hypothetical protein